MTEDDPDVRIDVSEGRESDKADKALQVSEFIKQAHEQFRTASDAEATTRADQIDDYLFSHGEPHQWLPEIKADRDKDNRPCLTINRVDGPARQIANQLRQYRQGIQVNPHDNQSDPKTAEVLQGIIRSIEVQSDADVVYGTAGNWMVRAGRGAWQVLVDFVDDQGFDQEIKLQRLPNPFCVYRDPACTQLDFSDARFMFVAEDVPKDEYNKRYGDSAMAKSLKSFESTGDVPPDWMPEGAVRVAAYWYVSEDPEVEISRIRVPDGSITTVPATQLESPSDITAGPERLSLWMRLRQFFFSNEQPRMPRENDRLWLMPDGNSAVVELIDSRKVKPKKVKRAVINAVEVLEGNDDKTAGADWPGKFIPIVIVVGDEVLVNGAVDFRGIVRNAKDPQRLSNVMKSAVAETIALAPKAPFIGVEGQFEGHEAKWDTANRRNWSYLEVAPTTVAGQPAPLPQRQAIEPPIQALVLASQQAESDLRATTGYFDVYQSETRREQSGKAILARQRQAEVGQSNFLDNLGFGIRHTGRILLDLIPKVYTAPQVRRILGTDDKPRQVMVHSNTLPARDMRGGPVAPEDAARRLGMAMDGIEGIYNIGVGKYDVSISVGPSFQTRRIEAVERMVELVQAQPRLMEIAGDLLLEQMDWPGARQIASRLRKLLPPPLQEDAEGKAPQIPPKLQQQMQAMGEQMKQMATALRQAQTELQSKRAELEQEMRVKQMEIASKERIEAMKLQAEAALAQVKAQSEQAEVILKAQEARMRQDRELAHKRGMVAIETAADIEKQQAAAALAAPLGE